MAEYFRSRNLPVPRELERNILTDWRRLGTIAAALLVLYIGLRITDIDTSRANPEYAFGVLLQLLQWDFAIMSPQNEFETVVDTAGWKMVETIFLAIVATAFSMVVALPLSFLGARNIMTGHPITAVVYAVVRVIFTVVRSIDVLIVVIVAVIIFGLGSAAGVFGLAFHNFGVLGKLYSEAIEGIDRGPVDAITATGATRLQILRFGVLPQVLPLFLSYVLYRLETNIRAATVLGFVGAGGIGFYLQTYLRMIDYPAASTVLLVTVLIVMAVDFVSSRLRQRLV